MTNEELVQDLEQIVASLKRSNMAGDLVDYYKIAAQLQMNKILSRGLVTDVKGEPVALEAIAMSLGYRK